MLALDILLFVLAVAALGGVLFVLYFNLVAGFDTLYEKIKEKLKRRK